MNKIEPGDRREQLPRWLLDCAARYTAVFAVGWAITSAVAPRMFDTEASHVGSELPFWESYWGWLSSGPSTFAMVGLPSLCMLLIISGSRFRGDSGGFRLKAGLLFLIPLWFTVSYGLGLMQLTMAATQWVFTFWLMPLPVRESVPQVVEP